MNKHPVYGYLTEEEFNAMRDAPMGVRQRYLKIAAKREKDAKFRRPYNKLDGNGTISDEERKRRGF